MTKLQIEYRPISELRPHTHNPRTHSKKQVKQLAASITKFGWTNPPLIDDQDCIVAGHGRVAAAELLGLSEIPTVRLSNMSEADIRAYVIADNRLAENAGWDKSLLAIEFDYLSGIDVDFDLTLTGFELAEIEGLSAGKESDSGPDPLDDIPPPADQPITRLGDVWEIGPHRLVCGDATDQATHRALMGDAKAAMVFSDAPYNVAINGHVSGLGKHKHREFAMASGEMTTSEYTAFLTSTFANLARYSTNGSIHYQCIDWRHAREMSDAGMANYTELKNICVWDKGSGGMGSLYRSGHEFVFVFKSGAEPHINNVELGKNGRYRTNVWNYPGASSFGRTRDSDLAMHPTVKPVAMVADCMLDCSKRGDIVLDPFAGSGTTLVAAQRTKRRGFGIELDPLYCDVIIRRMQTLFELSAVRVSDGVAFENASNPAQPVKPWEQAA